ncbi:MAG: flagellar export protein FliJ [Desulfobacteraceae bacterium]|nr:flagellar export protein FliJ [Desulfobacteraceae bacterium]
MKKFKFSLESVLKYRIFLEKEARQALMSINLDINECEENIESLKYKRILLYNELESETDKGITIEYFNMYQNYISSVDQRLENEKSQLIKLLREKDLRTLKLIEARKQKEALEKLKTRKKNQYIEEMLYEEQKELDEISSVKKAREICNES